MRHLSTIICDDIRYERGNKHTIVGVYEEAIVFQKLPARLQRFGIYQRWEDVSDAGPKALVRIRGVPVGEGLELELRTEADREGNSKLKAVIAISFGPVGFVAEGLLEITTEWPSPGVSYTHTMEVRTGKVE